VSVSLVNDEWFSFIQRGRFRVGGCSWWELFVRVVLQTSGAKDSQTQPHGTKSTITPSSIHHSIMQRGSPYMVGKRKRANLGCFITRAHRDRDGTVGDYQQMKSCRCIKIGRELLRYKSYPRKRYASQSASHSDSAVRGVGSDWLLSFPIAVGLTTSRGVKVLSGASAELVARLQHCTNETVRVVITGWYDYGHLRGYWIQSIGGLSPR
jgi:hypothetical protein